MRCNRNGDSPPTDIQSLPIKAGDILGFKLDYVIQHPGPLMAYMAKVPERKTAAIWDGSGKVVSSSPISYKYIEEAYCW